MAHPDTLRVKKSKNEGLSDLPHQTDEVTPSFLYIGKVDDIFTILIPLYLEWSLNPFH